MRFGDYALLFSSKRSGITRVPGLSRPQGAHRGQLPGLRRFVPLARTADAAVTLTERLPLAFDCSFGGHSTRNCSQIAGPVRTEPALRASGRSAPAAEATRNHIPDPRRAEDAPYFGTLTKARHRYAARAVGDCVRSAYTRPRGGLQAGRPPVAQATT